ncbi:hypothetical protein [Catellatospora sp. NPDC049609]|uniref:hypothetical protein n=1 Tax=Catellatospora sp. NPDC049609 TaxID=3155505 RepID=UPI003427A54E
MTRRYRATATAAELAALRPGEQPEADGQLLCRVCGRWRRQLATHLVAGHGTDPAAYRAEFQLPATRALMGSGLRDAATRRARDRYQTDPRVRDFLTQPPAERDERLRRGREAKTRTEHRAGVQAGKRAAGLRLAEHARRRAEHAATAMDELAAGLGHADLPALLAATTELSHAQLGALLGCTAAKARWWRTRHGIARTRGPRPAPGPPPGVPVIAGRQPHADDGRLYCLECWLPRANLAQHLVVHGLTSPAYRARHGLAADAVLGSAAMRRRWSDNARVGGAAAGLAAAAARKAAAVRADYDARARVHGFTDVVALLAHHPGPQPAAALLDVLPREVARLRRRYSAAGPEG